MDDVGLIRVSGTQLAKALRDCAAASKPFRREGAVQQRPSAPLAGFLASACDELQQTAKAAAALWAQRSICRCTDTKWYPFRMIDNPQSADTRW